MTNTIRTAGFQALIRALIDAREARGMTQRDLAAKLGCLQATIANIELGQRRLDVIEVCSLARALDIPAIGLFAAVVASVKEEELVANFSGPSKRGAHHI